MGKDNKILVYSVHNTYNRYNLKITINPKFKFKCNKYIQQELGKGIKNRNSKYINEYWTKNQREFQYILNQFLEFTITCKTIIKF